jgi:hypothetical protein
MPRTMPRFDLQFLAESARCIRIARTGEIIRDAAVLGSVAHKELHRGRLEDIYELAYLRVFIQWESFLESSFIRYMCGHQSRHGRAVMVAGTTYYQSINSAIVGMLGGNDYCLWHSSKKVIARSQQHFSASLHETVVRAARTDLDNFASVRHRIAHGQKDARKKFDNATMAFCGRRYPGSKAGHFLRDWDTRISPNIRWLESITQSLVTIAGLIV